LSGYSEERRWLQLFYVNKYIQFGLFLESLSFREAMCFLGLRGIERMVNIRLVAHVLIIKINKSP
jgi:hypothetical protein